jgi:predicted nucleotidyltransferase
MEQLSQAVPFVVKALKQFEQKHSVKVLFAADAGSRSYGWASVSSDFDVHLIYVHPTQYYLTTQEREKTFEETIHVSIPKRYLILNYNQDDEVRIEINISGFDIKHALQLFSRSNPAIVHMLISPIILIDRFHEEFSGTLINLCRTRISRRVICSSMISLVKTNLNRYIFGEPGEPQKTHVRLKVYLYILHHLFFVHTIYKETSQLPDDELELVTLSKGGKTVSFKRRRTPYDQLLPNLELLSLINDAEPIPYIRQSIIKLLVLKQASTEPDPLVPRHRCLELYFVLLLRELAPFAFYLPRTPDIDLQELDLLFQKALELHDKC